MCSTGLWNILGILGAIMRRALIPDQEDGEEEEYYIIPATSG